MGKATELIYFYAGVQYTVYENFQSPIFFDITERSSHSNIYRLRLPYQCPTYTINFINLNDGESDRINLFLRWGAIYGIRKYPNSDFFFDITQRSSHSNFYRLRLPYQCPTYTINFINLNDGETDRINLFLRWGAIYGIRKFPISDFFRYHRAIFALQFLSIKVALSMPYLHN